MSINAVSTSSISSRDNKNQDTVLSAWLQVNNEDIASHVKTIIGMGSPWQEWENHILSLRSGRVSFGRMEILPDIIKSISHSFKRSELPVDLGNRLPDEVSSFLSSRESSLFAFVIIQWDEITVIPMNEYCSIYGLDINFEWGTSNSQSKKPSEHLYFNHLKETLYTTYPNMKMQSIDYGIRLAEFIQGKI
jgi:hypothetical protein